MTSFVLNPFGRKLEWQVLFVVGIGSLLVAGLKFWWGLAPASYQPPPSAAAAPAPAPVIAPPSRPTSVSPLPTPAKIIQSLPPATSFGAPTVSPKSLPQLEGLERPAPAFKAPLPEFGFQPGYVPTPGPLHLRPD